MSKSREICATENWREIF